MIIKQPEQNKIVYKTINSTFHAVKNIIFPLRCLICSTLNQKVVCDNCINNITFIKQACKTCGHQLNVENKTKICPNCINTPPLFSSARSVVIYDEYSKDLICKFKFCDAIHAASFFSKWLIKLGADILNRSDLIIPVPLHRWKLFSRGYNQSSILSNLISHNTKIAVDHLSLKKIKNTPPQSQSSNITQRIQNIRKAFSVINNKKIENKNIILIDDVITTGATIHACTKSLLQSGAQSVHVLSIARTERPLAQLNSNPINYKINKTTNS